MALSGSWNLHFSWGCSGGYSTSQITFNTNGTFASAPYTGKWVQVGGMVAWRFDQSPNTVYAGNLMGGAITGLMSVFTGSNGCFYAISESGTAALAAEATRATEAAGEQLDVAGHPHGSHHK